MNIYFAAEKNAFDNKSAGTKTSNGHILYTLIDGDSYEGFISNSAEDVFKLQYEADVPYYICKALLANPNDIAAIINCAIIGYSMEVRVLVIEKTLITPHC